MHMDLLDCACDIPYEDEDKPHFFEDTRQIQCPMCLASTPPWDSRDQAIAAWNAMQQAMRAQDAQPVETMTVQIPVVLFGFRDRDICVSVPALPARWSPSFDPPGKIAAQHLGHLLGSSATHGAAHVITATLPVPQPPQVVEGSAETVGVGEINEGK